MRVRVMFVVAVTFAIWTQARSARADAWGCDMIDKLGADYAPGGHCCDYHDECYAANGCTADFEGRWEAAAACASCDLWGWGWACTSCFYGQAYYLAADPACFECDHAAALCVTTSNQGICPAGPGDCLGETGYPASNVCGIERDDPWRWLGRGCAGDQFCGSGQCDMSTGMCIVGGDEVPPTDTYPRLTPQCYPDCTDHPIPGDEGYQCGLIFTYSTCGGVGAEYDDCPYGQTCNDDHQCVDSGPCGDSDGDCIDDCDASTCYEGCDLDEDCYDDCTGQDVCSCGDGDGDCYDDCTGEYVGCPVYPCGDGDGDCYDDCTGDYVGCPYYGSCGDGDGDCYDDCSGDYVCGGDPGGGGYDCGDWDYDCWDDCSGYYDGCEEYAD